MSNLFWLTGTSKWLVFSPIFPIAMDVNALMTGAF